MRSKILAFCGVALVVCSAGAQNKTYTVRQGDTISGIAGRLQVRQAELVAVNSLTNSNVVRPGMVLRVPARSVKSSIPAAPKGAAYHTVRNGENDWTLARKHGITIAQLKAMNPNINFAKLQIGTRISIPATKAVSAVAVKSPAKSVPSVKVSVKTEKVAQVSAKPKSKIYKVQKNENDWIIARKFDTTTKKLRELNPGVNLAVLQIGQQVRVPGSEIVAKNTATKVASASRIKSKYAKVTGDNAIIRRGAKLSAAQITMVDRGTQVVVLDHQNGWYKLRFPKGTIGWMRGDLLKPVKAIDAIHENRAKSVVASKSAPTKSTATKAKTPVKTSSKTVVAKNTPAKTKKSVTSTKSKNPLVKSSTRVAMNRPGAPVASKVSSGLLANADAKTGTRYRWGGTSRSGYDCSGFVQSVYKSQGVSLPRTSRDMAGVGSKVSKSSLKPGDLVFFATGRGSRISHVGIYKGDGKFIHASSGKGKVVTSSLNDGYYSRRLVTARRVANVKSSSNKSSSKTSTAKKEAAKSEAAPIEGPG